MLRHGRATARCRLQAEGWIEPVERTAAVAGPSTRGPRSGVRLRLVGLRQRCYRNGLRFVALPQLPSQVQEAFALAVARDHDTGQDAVDQGTQQVLGTAADLAG